MAEAVQDLPEVCTDWWNPLGFLASFGDDMRLRCSQASSRILFEDTCTNSGNVACSLSPVLWHFSGVSQVLLRLRFFGFSIVSLFTGFCFGAGLCRTVTA